MSKYYFSRAQTRAWSSEYPIGDPTGGAAYGEKNDPATAVAGATVAGSLISSSNASDAAQAAAEAQRRASEAATAESRRQYDINQTNQAPYLQAGQSAVNRLGAGVMPGGEFGGATPFNFQYDPNSDPGTGFRIKTGVEALDRSAAARGGLLSGATLKGAQRYGQDLGSQEYQNAFNRYVTGFNANDAQRTGVYNRLAGVAGTGQNAANQIGASGANYANTVGNIGMNSAANIGNAGMAAAGMISASSGGAANALGRLYGPQRGQPLNDMYGSSNVYGYGGGGQMPTQDQFQSAAMLGDY
jgi:hypothetical protein